MQQTSQCGKHALAHNDHETCRHAAKVRRTGLCAGSQLGSSAPGEQGQEIKKNSNLGRQTGQQAQGQTVHPFGSAEHVIVAFFLSENSVFSGASRATRKLLIPKTELSYCSGSMPDTSSCFAAKAAENPGLLEADRHKKHFT